MVTTQREQLVTRLPVVLGRIRHGLHCAQAGGRSLPEPAVALATRHTPVDGAPREW
jgi:hypothetical protein